MAWIDLSRTITSGMAVYPGDPEVNLEQTADHQSDGCQLTRLSMGSHTGTHLDAPRHYLANGMTVERLDLNQLITPAYIASCRPGPDGLLDLTSLDLSGMKPGDALLLATGWEEKWGAEDYFSGSPQFAEGSSRRIIKLGINLLGVDLPTVSEKRQSCDLMAMHRELLGYGILLIENLVNLRSLAGLRVDFAALPLPLKDGDGSPVRACARPVCQTD